MNIAEHFDNFFELNLCRSTATIEACQHLRYMAYCEEHRYLEPEEFPDKLEKDEYDEFSQHLLITHRQTLQATATVRLILVEPDSSNDHFPIEKFKILRRMKRDMAWRVEKEKIGEISRFAISKTFRRRLEEKNLIHGITPSTFEIRDSGKRHMADITLGLFKAIVITSYQHKLTHWYALMEPALIRLLARFGIRFNLVGPAIDFFGVRQPCIAVIDDVLSGIHSHDPEIWRFITDDGNCYSQTRFLKTDEKAMA